MVSSKGVMLKSLKAFRKRRKKSRQVSQTQGDDDDDDGDQQMDHNGVNLQEEERDQENEAISEVEDDRVRPFDLSTRNTFYRNQNKTEMKLQTERKRTVEGIASYCMPLIHLEFHGQTSKDTKHDHANDENILNLGLYLSLLDKVIRKQKVVTDFSVEDEEFILLLKLVSTKRRHPNETTDECYERLKEDSKLFQRIYHERREISEVLLTTDFWGTRQQMLCGKVIVDWIDMNNHPMDPIFGVLLCPCGGRVGPGDSGWVHNLLYDQTGHMAYHAAVHDAFGYLITLHSVGPGYDYLKRSRLDKHNPLSGQYDGITFWKRVLINAKMQKDVVDGTLLIMLSGGEYLVGTQFM